MNSPTVVSQPRLTLDPGGTPAMRRALLLPETKRRATREVLSGCSADEANDSSQDYRAVEDAAQDRLDLIAENCQKAIAFAAAATANTQESDLAACARNYAEELKHPEKQLPKATNVAGEPEPFIPYVWAPPEYENTLHVGAFNAEGFEILSMRVTGATSVRTAALRHAWDLADEMRAASQPNLTLR